MGQRGTQQSVYYSYAESFLSRFVKREPFYPKTYVHMFIEDVKAGLYPLRRTEEKWLSLSIDDREVEEQIAAALDDNNSELKDALWSFMDKGLVYSLLMDQKAYYEIVYMDDDSFRFAPILNHTFFRFFDIIIQYVPPSQRNELGLPMFIKIKSENVFSITLPRKLRRSLAVIMRRLDYVSDNITMPKFAKEQMEKGASMYPMDYASYRKSIIKYVAKLTRKIGWNARGAYKAGELEYYNLVRFFRFEQFKLELRESIIQGLNQGLRTVKKDWGSPQLVQRVFPARSDIEGSVQKLREGSLKFGEIIKPYLEFF